MHEFNAVRSKKDAKSTARYSSTNKDKTQKDSESQKDDVTHKDMRHYRHFSANVTLVLLEIQAELSMVRRFLFFFRYLQSSNEMI